MKKIMTKYGSYLLTLLVVAVVIFSGPAQAITVGITGAPSSVAEGNNVQFQAKVDLHTNDIIPSDINFTVTMNRASGSDPSCTFALNGTELTTCSGFTISVNSSDIVLNGTNMNHTLYGYSSNGNKTWNNGTGAGSAYGYGYSGSAVDYSETLGDSTALVYDIVWTSIDVSANTAFTIELVASVPGATFTASDTSNEDSVTVTNTASSGSGSSNNDDDNGGGSDITLIPPSDDNDNEGVDAGEEGDNDADETAEPAPPLNFDEDEVQALVEAGDLIQHIEEVIAPDEEREFIFGGNLGSGSGRSGSHHMRLRHINYAEDPNDRFVVVEISSTPQNVTVFEGQSVSVDVDGDGKYDLLVRANDITEGNAKISISEISMDVSEQLSQGKTVEEAIQASQEVEEIPAVEPTEPTGTPDTPTDDSDNGGTNVLLIIIIIIFLLVLGLYLWAHYKHRSKPHFHYEDLEN